MIRPVRETAQYIEETSDTLQPARGAQRPPGLRRYYHSQAADANNVKSMSKSILSVLTGIAIDEA
jgi:hypothetical protein